MIWLTFQNLKMPDIYYQSLTDSRKSEKLVQLCLFKLKKKKSLDSCLSSMYFPDDALWHRHGLDQLRDFCSRRPVFEAYTVYTSWNLPSLCLWEEAWVWTRLCLGSVRVQLSSRAGASCGLQSLSIFSHKLMVKTHSGVVKISNGRWGECLV